MTAIHPAATFGEYDPTTYPPFAVATDVVMLTVREGGLQVLAVRRDQGPFDGALALPGTFLQPDEDALAAAQRALRDKAGVDPGTVHLEQLATFSAPDRDPRMRVVSIAHLVLLADPGDPPTGRWRPVGSGGTWAFDHAAILADGVERARAKLEYTTLATSLVAPRFTLRDLHRVYEAVWAQPVHYTNFRRKVTSIEGFVTDTGTTRPANANGSGRPTAVYTAGPATDLHPPLTRATTAEGEDTQRP